MSLVCPMLFSTIETTSFTLVTTFIRQPRWMTIRSNPTFSGAPIINQLLALAVKHLTFFDAGLTIVVLGGLLLRRRHATIVWWVVSTGLMVGLSFLLSRAGGMFYHDPRPLTSVHLKPLAPLIPFLPHLDHNSFPSSHAVFAAVLASSVLLLSRRWAIPIVIVGFLDTWARTGLGSHQVINVIGGWLIVALAALLAFLVGSIFAAVLLPAIPPSWTAERFRLRYRDQRVRSA